MSIPSPSLWATLTSARFLAGLLRYPLPRNIFAQKFFLRPNVYAWHHPETAANSNYFIIRHDPYEWFDPWVGRQTCLAASPDAADALAYAAITISKPTYIAIDWAVWEDDDDSR